MRMMEAKKEKIQTPFQESLKKILANKMCLISLIVLLMLSLFSIFGPMFTGYESDSIDLLNMLSGPSKTHLLGTDELGRDMLTRLAEGGRVSISVGLIATLFKLCIGVLLGCIAGLYGGLVESVIMRIVDIIMCFPFFVIALCIASITGPSFYNTIFIIGILGWPGVCRIVRSQVLSLKNVEYVDVFVIALCIASITGPSFYNTIFIIGILGWPGVCRIVRSQVLSLKNVEYVDAARSLGLSQMEIIFRHILPNASGPIIVYTTLSVANAILMEASLSFLGLGIAMPQSSWGTILSTAQNMQILQDCWWMWIPAGILVLCTVLAINFLGDGLSEILDPKKKGRGAD